jgi:predicted nucleic acid-binding protein
MFDILTLESGRLAEIAAIMRLFESSRIQLADAGLVYLAERDSIRTVFTTDRRVFPIIRLKRNRVLRLIPDAQ